jgi:hypothetical protein
MTSVCHHAHLANDKLKFYFIFGETELIHLINISISPYWVLGFVPVFTGK